MTVSYCRPVDASFKYELLRRLCRQLKERRIFLGLRQQDVARRVNVCRLTLSRWEQNDALPTSESLLAWIEALGGCLYTHWGDAEPEPLGGGKLIGKAIGLQEEKNAAML
jgi:transcriptional regulator with XRE-family HTH domain